MTNPGSPVVAAETFTLADARERWRCKWSVAAEIVGWLIARGMVEKVGYDTFVVTATGLAWSELLTDIARDVVEMR